LKTQEGLQDVLIDVHFKEIQSWLNSAGSGLLYWRAVLNTEWSFCFSKCGGSVFSTMRAQRFQL